MNSPPGARCPTEKDSEAGQLTRNSRTRSSLKGKQLTRSHAIKESTSPPRCSEQANQQITKSVDIVSDSDTSKQSSLLFSNHRKRDNYVKQSSNGTNNRVNGANLDSKRNACGCATGASRRTSANKNGNVSDVAPAMGHCYVVSDIVRDDQQVDPAQTTNQLTAPAPGPPRLEVVVSPKPRKEDAQFNDSIGLDLLPFLADTLNKNQKDRFTMLRIEKELVSLVKDKQRYVHKFPPMSSYNRMLVHRCAAFFGMEHNIDPSQQCVIVSKTAVTKLPPIHFKEYVKDISFEEPRKSILKRDAHSFDEARTHLRCPDRYYGLDNRRSKSFEEREEAYVKARQRIFKDRQSDENSADEIKCPWSSIESGELVLLSSGMDNSLHKMHSLDAQSDIYRPIVSKSFSFGGYSGPSSKMCRDDSINSTRSAGARLISKQDSCASGTPWRLSPSSSGYKTQSHSLHSDSITPSPTGHCSITPEPPQSPTSAPVVWAVTDITNVPKGSLLIDPQTGHPFLNKDGSIYTFDPDNLPPPNINNNQYDLSSPTTQPKMEKHSSSKKLSTEDIMHDIEEDETVSNDDVTKHGDKPEDVESLEMYNTVCTSVNSTDNNLDIANCADNAASPLLTENSKVKGQIENFEQSYISGDEIKLAPKVDDLSNQISAIEINDSGSKIISPNGTLCSQTSTTTNQDKAEMANPSFNFENNQEQPAAQLKFVNNNYHTPQNYQNVPVSQASVNSFVGEDGCYYPYPDQQLYTYPHIMPTGPYGSSQAPYTTLVLPDNTPYTYAYGSNAGSNNSSLLCPSNVQPIVYPAYGGQSMIFHTPTGNIVGYMPTQPLFYATLPQQTLMSLNTMPNHSITIPNTNHRQALIPHVPYPCPENIPSMIQVNSSQMNQFHMNQVAMNPNQVHGGHPAELPLTYNLGAETSQPNIAPTYNHLYMNYSMEPNYMYQNNRLPSQVMYVESSSPPNPFTRQNSLSSSSDGFLNTPAAKNDFVARNGAPLVRPNLPRSNRIPEHVIPRSPHFDTNLNRVFVHTKAPVASSDHANSYVPINNLIPCNYNNSSTPTSTPREQMIENGRVLELNNSRMALSAPSQFSNPPRMPQPYFIPSGQIHPYINAPNIVTTTTEDSNTANVMNRANNSFINGNVSYNAASQAQPNHHQNIRMKSNR